MFNCHSDKSNDGHESFMINDVQNMTFFVPSITTQKQRLPKMIYQHACFYRSVHHSIVRHIFVCGSCVWFCICEKLAEHWTSVFTSLSLSHCLGQRALSSMCVSSKAILIFSVSPQSSWSLPHAWVWWSKFDTPPWLCIFSRCEAISPILASYQAICAFINLGSRKSGHEVN